MNFLGIGPFELLLILVIATIVLGPERMAQAGRTLGRLYGQYRIRWQKDVDEMTRELRRELEMLQQEVEEIRQSAESEIVAAQTAFEDTIGTRIDLNPLAGDVDAAKTDTASAVQPDQDSAALPDQTDRDDAAAPAEAGSAAGVIAASPELTSDDQALTSVQSGLPQEQSSSTDSGQESSAEQESLAEVDSAMDPQASSVEVQEMDDALENQSKPSGAQSTHLEKGEAEGEQS